MWTRPRLMSKLNKIIEYKTVHKFLERRQHCKLKEFSDLFIHNESTKFVHLRGAREKFLCIAEKE